MEPFWPSLPFGVPGSQGITLWWYAFWWVFQIVVYTWLVVMLTRWALRMDRIREAEFELTTVSVTDSGQSLSE